MGNERSWTRSRAGRPWRGRISGGRLGHRFYAKNAKKGFDDLKPLNPFDQKAVLGS